MRILITGDVHGDLEGFAEIVAHAREHLAIDAAVQVGDFGFYPRYIDEARRTRLRFAVPVYAIDGNHEDHAWLAQAAHFGEVRQWRTEFNLHYQRPRPAEC